MSNDKVYQMSFSKVYPLLVNKAVKKGRSKEEVDEIIRWLTGYSQEKLEENLEAEVGYGDFFRNAPELNPGRTLIKGTVCGVRVEEIEEPLMREIRYLDKLIDDLAKGKAMDKGVMAYKIRAISEGEESLLEDFLYEAIFVPEGVSAPPKSIINQPELQVYITDFGKKKDDIGLAVEVDKKAVGAVWVRIMNDYGHIDNETPSLAISLYKEYRGLGIGTALIKEMLRILKDRGYKQTSLAVQKSNYAVKMYQKTGFEIWDENEEEYIMLCRL